MFTKNQLRSADVIVGLGCHDIAVADDVSEVYLNGYASRIVFTGNMGRMTEGKLAKSEASYMRDRAIELGVPSDAIQLEELSTNTGENVRFTQELLKDIDLKRIILIHKPYMLRRDYATFMKQWSGADSLDVICWAREVDCKDYVMQADDPAEEIAIIVGDLQRIKVYFERGFQVEQYVPPFVWEAFDALVAKGYTKHLVA